MPTITFFLSYNHSQSPTQNVTYNHSQSRDLNPSRIWSTITHDHDWRSYPITVKNCSYFLEKNFKRSSPFFYHFVVKNFERSGPYFFTILLWRIFKDSAPFLLFFMSMYVDIFTKQVIGNDLEFQITITKNVSHDHSRSWLAKVPSKWATITHIHDLIGNDCRSHSLIGISVQVIHSFLNLALNIFTFEKYRKSPICCCFCAAFHRLIF